MIYYTIMTAKIKLLVMTHNYPRFEGDFAGVFLALLLQKLRLFGIEPIVLAPHDKGCKEYEELAGIKIYRFRYAADENDETLAYRGNMHQLVLGSVGGLFSFKRFLDCWRKAAFEIIKKERIDVLSGHWLIPAGLVLKPLAKKTGLPVVLSSHGTDIRLMRKYFKVVYRYLKSFCLRLKSWTVVSTFLKNGIVEMDARLDRIIEVLPMPHDETIFYKDESIEKKNLLITSVTRYTDQKRVAYLIKAMALVHETIPEAKLALYGTGPLEEELHALAAKFGLEKVISFKEPVPQKQLREVYNSSRVVVLNSFDEGFGLTLSEAMMCGTAVVGTASGGITDIIEHDKTGLLVPLDNSAELAKALIQILSDDSLRIRLEDTGWKTARDKYTSARLAQRYARIIHDAVGRDFKR